VGQLPRNVPYWRALEGEAADVTATEGSTASIA
jgi:hypothetical protein